MSQWRTATLGELIAEGPTNGYSGATASDAMGSPTLRLSATTSGALVLDETTTKRLNETIPPNSPLWLRPGDLLVQRSNTLDLVGTAAIYDGPLGAFIYPDLMMRIRLRAKIDPRFIWRYLNSPVGRTAMRRIASGSAGSMPKISGARLRTLPVPVPPLSAQRRIAEILGKVDGLQAKRRAALAQFDTLTQSIFLDMFGDPATNPKGWPTVSFGQLGENQDSLRVPVKASDRDGRQGMFAYYGASGIIDWVDDFIFEGERLLIGEDGANLVVRVTPVAFMAREKYWVNNHAHVIAENDRADLRFLEHVIERTDLKPFLSGTAQPKLNRGNLDRIPVPAPPLLLQREFARRIAAIEQLKADHYRSVAGLDRLFGTLQFRAFRGEL